MTYVGIYGSLFIFKIDQKECVYDYTVEKYYSEVFFVKDVYLTNIYILNAYFSVPL